VDAGCVCDERSTLIGFPRVGIAADVSLQGHPARYFPLTLKFAVKNPLFLFCFVAVRREGHRLGMAFLVVKHGISTDSHPGQFCPTNHTLFDLSLVRCGGGSN